MIEWQWNGGLNEQWTVLNSGNGPVVTNYFFNVSSFLALDDPNFSCSARNPDPRPGPTPDGTGRHRDGHDRTALAGGRSWRLANLLRCRRTEVLIRNVLSS